MLKVLFLFISVVLFGQAFSQNGAAPVVQDKLSGSTSVKIKGGCRQEA